MASLDYVTSVNSTTDASSYTFSAVSLGAADANRLIVVLTGARAASPRTITAVTIGGVTATELRDSSADQTNGSIWIAAVPTGTTGDIVLTYSGTMVRANVAVFRGVGISPTPVDVDSHGIAGSSSAARTVTLDSVAGGFVVGGFVGSGTTPTLSWSGATEDYDFSYETSGNRASGAHGSTAGSSVTVTATPSGSFLDGILVAATFQPLVSAGSIAANTPTVTVDVPTVSWSGTVTPPTSAGSIAADTPGVTVAVPTVAWAGTVSPPVYAGAIDADTPGVTVGVPAVSWAGAVAPPVYAGEIDADLPSVTVGVPTVAWSGTVESPAVTGDLVADLPPVAIGVPTVEWSGTVLGPPVEGAIVADTPVVTVAVPTVAWAGTVEPPVYAGAIDAAVPLVSVGALTVVWAETTTPPEPAPPAPAVPVMVLEVPVRVLSIEVPVHVMTVSVPSRVMEIA